MLTLVIVAKLELIGVMCVPMVEGIASRFLGQRPSILTRLIRLIRFQSGPSQVV